MELEFIRWLRERMPAHPLLKIGLGDDAAVLAMAGRGDVVVTTDLITDGVDFDLRVHEPRRIGHKALAVNLSDLAAMAARPLAVVVAVNLPKRFPDTLPAGGESVGASPRDTVGLYMAKELFEGMLPLAERFHVAIAGGDTNSWDGGLVICVTAIGEVTPRGPLTRSGARPGDRIIVTGSFGGSIHGRHLDVEPRVAEALLLNDRYPLHAGIDCSDGLSLDLSRLAEASKCGALIDLDHIPLAAVVRQHSDNVESENAGSKSLVERALSDGEDFELILAVPPKDAEKMLADQPLEGVTLTDIGEFIAEAGLWRRGGVGGKEVLKPCGFEHSF
jgi:thiamine-monophosphate kinase